MEPPRTPKEPRLRVHYKYGVRGWVCFDKIAIGWGITQQSAYGRYQDQRNTPDALRARAQTV